jgi:hypothetical protein
MASHGTSRPVHYTIPRDEANHKPEQVQNIDERDDLQSRIIPQWREIPWISGYLESWTKYIVLQVHGWLTGAPGYF